MTDPSWESSVAWRELLDGLAALDQSFLAGDRAVADEQSGAEGYRALLAAQNAKSVKGRPVAKPPLAPIPAKAKPEAPAVEVRATTRDLAPAADVALPSSGLVYARVERRE